MTDFYEGAAVQLHATFTNLAGVEIDPDTVAVTWKEPNGQEITRTFGAGGSPAIVRASLGNFTLDLDTTEKPGTWRFYWQSTGTGQAAKEGEFDVRNAFV
jgi:hypothetical protein